LRWLVVGARQPAGGGGGGSPSWAVSQAEEMMAMVRMAPRRREGNGNY